MGCQFQYLVLTWTVEKKKSKPCVAGNFLKSCIILKDKTQSQNQP